MKTLSFILVFFLAAQMNSQEKQMAMKNVEATAYNYIDTFYKADTTLAYKSVHQKLRKVGWWYDSKKNSYSGDLEMPFDALIKLAKKWNVDGKNANADSPRKVVILEVSDKIAVAKVTAVWGIDYLNMVNTDGGWKIINIVWQSKPKFSMEN